MSTLPDAASIVKMARELWEDQGKIDVDIVDGAFYWTCCRRDYLDFLDGLPEVLHTAKDKPSLTAMLESIDRWGILNTSLRDIIMRGGHPNMRGAFVALRAARMLFPTIGGEVSAIQQSVGIGVTSRLWKGSRVEEALRVFDHDHPEEPEDEINTKTGSQAYRGFHYWAQFFPDGTAYDLLPDALSQFYRDEVNASVRFETPFVWFEVSRPFPAPGVIADAYDALATDWRDQLLPPPTELGDSGMGVAVAIRTWMMVLLRATGMKSRDVERAVEEHLPGATVPVEKVYYGQKRDLLRRVPELTPILEN